MKNASLCQVCALPNTLSELFVQVSQKGQITLLDRYVLMAIVLRNSINENEEESINRLLYAVRRGWVKVVDEV